MHGALGPTHFRDVDKSFDALFQFDKSSVVGATYHLAFDSCPDGIGLSHVAPRVKRKLLPPERHTAALGGVLEDDNYDDGANLEQLRGMLKSARWRVGRAEQTVESP